MDPVSSVQPTNFQRFVTNLKETTIKVAKIALAVIGLTFLFVSNPTMFAIGFLVGFIFDKQVEEQIEKIKRVFEIHGWKAYAGLGLGAFLAIQVVVGGVLAFGGGAYCGSRLARTIPQTAS